MKIGIITYHRALNYGAFLQVLALQDHLRQLGADVQIIDYTPYEEFIGTRWRKVPVAGKLMNWYRKRVDKRKRVAFYGGKSIEQYLDLTRRYLSVEELHSDPPKCDVYICGSDQIWNPNLIISEGLFDAVDAYFLNFGSDSVRRISYAASIGNTSLPNAFLQRIQPLLKRFTAVSVREDSSVGLLDEIGVAASWVCDPTLLHDAQFYKGLMNSKEMHERRAFCYLIRTRVPDELISSLGTQGFSIKITLLKRDKNLPSVFEWLELIANSGFVVTDSFHCVIFCLIFKRPFVVIAAKGKNEGMNDRIISLLKLVGLENLLIYEKNLNSQYMLNAIDKIDWDKVDKKVDDIQKKSKTAVAVSINICESSDQGC